jgi:hypothetical protein
MGTPAAAVPTATRAPAVAPLRLLAFHFEEAAFDRWYVFLVLFVVTLVTPLATRLVSDGVSWVVAGGSLRSYFNGEAAKRLSADAAALPGFAWAVAILLTPWLFNRWRRAVGPTVYRLTQSGRLLGPTAPSDPESVETYLQLQTDLRRAVLSPRRYLFVAIGFVLFLAPAVRLALTIGPLSYTRQLGAVGLVYDLRSLLLLWVWAPVLLYFLGIGAWSMYVTSMHLKRLVEERDVTVQPNHPDRCGGWAPLGGVVISSGLTVAFVVVVFAIGVSPLNTFIDTALKFAGAAGFIIFGIPLVESIVVAPLRALHLKMVAAKEHYEDTVAARLSALEVQVLASLDAGALDRAKESQAELEIVRSLYPTQQGYPTWPFTGGASVSFVSAQALSILGPVAGVLWQAVVASR